MERMYPEGRLTVQVTFSVLRSEVDSRAADESCHTGSAKIGIGAIHEMRTDTKGSRWFQEPFSMHRADDTSRPALGPPPFFTQLMFQEDA